MVAVCSGLSLKKYKAAIMQIFRIIGDAALAENLPNVLSTHEKNVTKVMKINSSIPLCNFAHFQKIVGSRIQKCVRKQNGVRQIDAISFKCVKVCLLVT